MAESESSHPSEPDQSYLRFSSMEEADRLNMKFRLDERNVKQRLLDGQPDPLNPDEYDVYPRKNGWTYKGFQMETAITDTEDQCPYAFDAASSMSLLTPWTRVVSIF